jgi:hypothetical protein
MVEVLPDADGECLIKQNINSQLWKVRSATCWLSIRIPWHTDSDHSNS